MLIGKNNKKHFLEFPESFRNLIGTRKSYTGPEGKKFTGVVADLRWSRDLIAMNNDLKHTVLIKGIEMQIVNKEYGDSIWTEAFCSGVIYHDDDFDLINLN